MVGNGIEAITGAVDLHAKAGALILEARQQNDIMKVHVPAVVGNWVTHYETSVSSGISPHVLLGVRKTIDALADCFMFDGATSGTTTRRCYKSPTKKK